MQTMASQVLTGKEMPGITSLEAAVAISGSEERRQRYIYSSPPAPSPVTSSRRTIVNLPPDATIRPWHEGAILKSASYLLAA